MDWVLLELRNSATPATVVARRAALIRRDGRIVDLDGTSDVSWRNAPNGNYFLAMRHRNHLGIRSTGTMIVDGTLGAAVPPTYDYTTSQAMAFQDPAVLALPVPNNNAAMKDYNAGTLFAMWGGNGNANTTTRASGGGTVNDVTFLIATVLGNNPALILNNVYSRGDYNMDGVARASGGGSVNDGTYLVATVLGNNPGKIITQHQ